MGLLDQLGGLDADEMARLVDLRRPVFRNHAGLEVGSLTAEVRVLEPVR
jgi:hypothetical protein